MTTALLKYNMNSVNKVVAIAAIMMSWVTAAAEIPSGYYDRLDGLADPAQLKTAVHDIVSPHTTPQSSNDYNTYYYNGLPVYFRQTDVYPESNRWWDMYSDKVFYAPSMSGLNREHSFPKSWWGGSTTIPPFVDLNHLYPAERDANMAKSNYPLGDVDMGENVTFDNGVSKVGYPVSGQGANAKRVFEPDNRYKGDFARTYFYMVTCYQDLQWNPSYSWMLQSNTYPTLKPWAQELLLRWAKEDPVSQKEIDRNEAVYRIQNNRNPFIDLPGLEEYIWGDKKYQTYHVTGSTPSPGDEPILFAPVADMSLEFNEVAVGGTARSLLLFKGQGLKGKISVRVTPRNATMFTIDDNAIDASVINSADGYYLPVTYRPETTGEHTANITVYDVTGWPSGASLNVSLHGRAVETPRLSRIVALPASDITSTGYVANWEVPAGEVIDFYEVRRTHRLPDGTEASETIQAEENSLAISGYNADLYDYYTVRSVRLGYRSPESNIIYVGNAGFDGVIAEMPLQVVVYGNVVRFLTSEPLSGGRVYDLSGRMVMTLPVIERNMEIVMAPGVYFVTADEHHTPVKILIR